MSLNFPGYTRMIEKKVESVFEKSASITLCCAVPIQLENIQK